MTEAVKVQVTNLETKAVCMYPSIALAAMGVRTTYPSLCYHLRRDNNVLVNGVYLVEKVVVTTGSNRALVSQVRNLDTGELYYFSTIRKTAQFLQVTDRHIRRLAKGRIRFTIGRYLVYLIR